MLFIFNKRWASPLEFILLLPYFCYVLSVTWKSYQLLLVLKKKKKIPVCVWCTENSETNPSLVQLSPDIVTTTRERELLFSFPSGRRPNVQHFRSWRRIERESRNNIQCLSCWAALLYSYCSTAIDSFNWRGSERKGGQWRHGMRNKRLVDPERFIVYGNVFSTIRIQ